MCSALAHAPFSIRNDITGRRNDTPTPFISLLLSSSSSIVFASSSISSSLPFSDSFCLFARICGVVFLCFLEFLLLEDEDEDEDEEAEDDVVVVVIVFSRLFGSTDHKSILCRWRMATNVYSMFVCTNPCAGTGNIQL